MMSNALLKKHAVKICAAMVLWLLVASCARQQDMVQQADTVLSCAADAEYFGILDHPVRLSDGKWEGRPFVPDGASRPRAGLLEDFYIFGDIDQDGHNEAVVILWENSGGSGTFYYLSVLEMSHNGCRNCATDFIGDRVKIEGGRVEHGAIVLNVLQAGPEDPACCPSVKRVMKWQFRHGKLKRED